MQHLPGVYSLGSEIPESFLGVDSSAVRLGRAAIESSQRDPYLWEVLPQQQIRVFVRPTLPGTLWIAEVDLHIGSYRKVLVFRHLQSAIPRQRAPQGSGKFANMPTPGIICSKTPASGSRRRWRSFWHNFEAFFQFT